MSTTRSPTSSTTAVGVGAAAQDRPDPGVQLLGAERLDDVVVRAGVERGDRGRVVVAGGGDDHRDRAHRPEHPQQLDAVDVGQPEVEHDEVRRVVEHPSASPGIPAGSDETACPRSVSARVSAVRIRASSSMISSTATGQTVAAQAGSVVAPGAVLWLR